ncbi:MAG TPA: PEP/pyruvate-binding domain-containing protein, partial [Limnochordia bacterium]
PGICLTAAAFRAALAPFEHAMASLWTGEHLSAEGARAAAERIAALLTDLRLPEAAAAALRDALAALGDPETAWVVRSSATAEDRGEVSFAGQYESVLGVRGEEALHAAIVRCWRSFFHPHALVARAGAGMIGGAEAMAVLIQPLVDAECAGVCFTLDPRRPAQGEILIEAAWGLGPGIVDGSVATDTFTLSRRTLDVIDRRISEKRESVRPGPAGGTAITTVEPERRRAATLPSSWLRRLGEFALTVEQQLGGPQDIEWAIGGGRCWLLQSRPITTIPAALRPQPFPVVWEDPSDQKRLWRLDESQKKGPALPLAAEVEDAFSAARAEAAVINGQDEGPRRRRFSGWSYVTSVPTELSAGDKRVRRTIREERGRRLWEAGMTSWEYRAPEVIPTVKRLRDFDVEAADGPQLAEHLEDAFGAFRLHWCIHWLGVGGSFSRPFREALAKVCEGTDHDVDQVARRLLAGEETELTRLIDRLWELAQLARGTPTVAAYLRENDSPELSALAQLPGSEAFRAALARLIADYGERTGAGFGSDVSIEQPTWRERPELILKLLQPYLAADAPSPQEARAAARADRDRLLDTLCTACEDRDAVEALRRTLPLARRGAADLENHNYYIDQLSYGQLRRAILAAGRHLTAHGALERPEDVFWLRQGEITAALRQSPPSDCRSRVEERRAEHARATGLEPPPVIGLPAADLPPRGEYTDEVTPAAEPPRDDRLRGTAASPGRRRGRVRVVPMDALVPDVAPGDVLVAENAGPLWTPIFPLLAGIVLDRGSVGQHAATTAREYGIPAVLGTGQATRRLRDGQWVTVDGDAGVVELQEAGSE